MRDRGHCVFVAAEVRFLIVGAYALALHGRPRATGDLGVWVEATPENAGRIMRALAEFGAPLSEISEADFARPGITYQIGLPPGRIDILTDLTGLTFADAWPDRLRRAFGDVEVDFIGRCLVHPEQTCNRPPEGPGRYRGHVIRIAL